MHLGACWGTELHRSKKGGMEGEPWMGGESVVGDQRMSLPGEGLGPAPSFQEPVVTGSGLGVPKSGLAGKSFQLRTGNPWPSSRR